MNKRLKQYLIFKRLTMAELEREIGAANGTLSKPIRRGSAIGSDKIEKIFLAHPDLSAEWLMRGEGDMLKNPQQANSPEDDIRIQMLEAQVKALTQEKDNYWLLIQKLTEK